MKKLTFVCLAVTLGFIINQCFFDKKKNTGQVLISEIKNDFLRSFITEDHMSGEMLMVFSDKDNKEVKLKTMYGGKRGGMRAGEQEKNYYFNFRVWPIDQIGLGIEFKYRLVSYDPETQVYIEDESFDVYFLHDDTRPTHAPGYFTLRVSPDNIITIGENTQHHDLIVINDRLYEDIYCNTSVYKSELKNIDSLNYQICVKEGVGLLAVITEENTLVFEGFEKGPPVKRNYKY